MPRLGLSALILCFASGIVLVFYYRPMGNVFQNVEEITTLVPIWLVFQTASLRRRAVIYHLDAAPYPGSFSKKALSDLFVQRVDTPHLFPLPLLFCPVHGFCA